jgi:hypothetical protein
MNADNNNHINFETRGQRDSYYRPRPKNKVLMNNILNRVKKMYNKYPSPMASAMATKMYNKEGGQWEDKGGNPSRIDNSKLKNTFKQKWTSINPILGKVYNDVFRPTNLTDKYGAPNLLQDTPIETLRSYSNKKKNLNKGERLKITKRGENIKDANIIPYEPRLVVGGMLVRSTPYS